MQINTSCQPLSERELSTNEALYATPATPSSSRCRAWPSELGESEATRLSAHWRDRLSWLAAYWLKPFAQMGIFHEMLSQRSPANKTEVEHSDGVAEGRHCMLVVVKGGRVFVRMPRYARNFGLSVAGCDVTNEKGRLTTVLRMLLLTLRMPRNNPKLPFTTLDFQFRLCGDDFCHGLWEQRAVPFFTMVSCMSAPTIPAVQWNTLEGRDPDLSVWELTMTRRKQLRKQHEQLWRCRKKVAVWRGSLNDMHTYNLFWSDNRTIIRTRIDTSNWQRAGRAALAYQRCIAKERLDVRFKLLRQKLRFTEASACVKAASTDRPNRMSMPAQFGRFKYVVHVEGNGGWADRLRHVLMGGVLVLKQDMGVQEWYEPLLKPWEHFVPVSSTLHNLSDAVEWAQKHDAQAARIAKAAGDLMENLLSEAAVVFYQAELFRQYANLWQSGETILPALSPGFYQAEFNCSFTVAGAGPNESSYIGRDCYFIDMASGMKVSSFSELAAKPF